MALRFYANTSPAAGNTAINNYSRVSMGNFAVTTNQITLSAFVNITNWDPTGNDIRVIVKQNVSDSSISQPITFRSSQSAATSATNVNTLAVPRPSGIVAGDLLVVGIYVTTNDGGKYGTITYPAGFQQAQTVQGHGNQFNKLFVAYKIANATDTGATNFTFNHTPESGTTTYRIAAILAAYSNVDPVNPLDVQATTFRTADDPAAASFSIFAPSITPTNADPKRLLCFYGVGGGQGPTDGYNTIAPVSQTERAEVTGGPVGYGRLMLADEAYASTAATGTRTATITDVGAAPGNFSAKASFSVSLLLRTNSNINTSAKNYQWYLGLNRAGTSFAGRTIAARFNYSDATLLGTNPLQTNRWYHIAAVYNNGTGRIYLDGKLEGTLTTFNPGAFANDGHPVVLGNNAPDAANILIPNSPNGFITQPAIWNVALSDKEIESLALGATPYKIRASSLVSFSPQLGFNDIDVIRGTKLTEFNTDPAPDPRIIVGSTKPTKLKKYPVYSNQPGTPTLSVTATSFSSVQVIVTAVAPTNSTITSYVVQRSTTPTGWPDEVTGVNDDNYVDTGLFSKTTYYYRAKYLLNDGRSSQWSETQEVTTPEDTDGIDPLAPIVTAISSTV